jgi:hypothetical protein
MASAALCSGLCTCYLRLRKAKDAVQWCDKAHAKAPDDLPTLYLLADAKALNGEEHGLTQRLYSPLHACTVLTVACACALCVLQARSTRGCNC